MDEPDGRVVDTGDLPQLRLGHLAEVRAEGADPGSVTRSLASGLLVGLAFPFGRRMWVPLVFLQVSALVRVVGDLSGADELTR